MTASDLSASQRQQVLTAIEDQSGAPVTVEAGAARAGGVVMFLVIELILTVVAWRRGWGAKALRPLGAGIALAFVIGLFVGASGGSFATATTIGVVIDLACIAVLSVMAVRAPDRYEAPASPTYGSASDASFGTPAAPSYGAHVAAYERLEDHSPAVR